MLPLGQRLGFLVAGLKPVRPLDDGYRDFLGLIAGQLAAGLTTARAYEAERRRAETLLELDQAKTAFFTNVSHELRTPLTLLLGPGRGRADRRRRAAAAEQRERVERIHRNAQRLLKLVNTLLDFSRLQSGRLNASYAPIDLARYTAELASMFESAVERAGPGADDRLPAAAAAGPRRRRDVGQDRPEPALQRAQVHVRGRRDGAAARDRRRGAS